MRKAGPRYAKQHSLHLYQLIQLKSVALNKKVSKQCFSTTFDHLILKLEVLFKTVILFF